MKSAIFSLSTALTIQAIFLFICNKTVETNYKESLYCSLVANIHSSDTSNTIGQSIAKLKNILEKIITNFSEPSLASIANQRFQTFCSQKENFYFSEISTVFQQILLLSKDFATATAQGITFPLYNDSGLTTKGRASIPEELTAFLNPSNNPTILEWLESALNLIIFLERKSNSLLVSQFVPIEYAPNNSQKKLDLQPHEEWYIKHTGKTVSWNVFENNWCQSIFDPSRIEARKHIREKNYSSILDVPCGMCHEYFGFKHDHYPIEYTGVDIVPDLIALAHKKNITAFEGNIEALPFENNTFDVTYARWILESLPYYSHAINELIRVAKKEVIITFFMGLHENREDQLQIIRWPEPYLHYNIYNKKKLESFILSNHKVNKVEWKTIKNPTDIMLYILLHNE